MSPKSKDIFPRFFCENCGEEVPRDSKNCPKCGRSFASVRCPACGFIGKEELFLGGCPVCNYSAGDAPTKKPKGKPKSRNEAPVVTRPAGPLPLWVYLLTAAAFIGVLLALYFRF